jgi:hypothetical protein
MHKNWLREKVANIPDCGTLNSGEREMSMGVLHRRTADIRLPPRMAIETAIRRAKRVDAKERRVFCSLNQLLKSHKTYSLRITRSIVLPQKRSIFIEALISLHSAA